MMAAYQTQSFPMIPLPPVDSLDMYLMSAITSRPFTNGLAIVIGCPTSSKKGHPFLCGAQHDLRRGMEVFEDHLMFVTLCLEDPTMKHIQNLIKVVSKLNENAVRLPESWRRIVVLFSGHGDEGDVLYTKDGTLSLQEDIVMPLLAMTAKNLAPLPKLFFIDACRGREVDRGIEINWYGSGGLVARGEQRVSSMGNFLVACSTLPGMQSFEQYKGGLWMQLLLNQLVLPDGEEDSILTVMTKVSSQLIGICNQEQFYVQRPHIQQPIMQCTLTEEVKLFKEAQALRLLCEQFQLQQQQQQQQQQQPVFQEEVSSYGSMAAHPMPPLQPYLVQRIGTSVPPLPQQGEHSAMAMMQSVQFRGSQEAATPSRPATKIGTAKPKSTNWKLKLEEYFNAKGLNGKKVVNYRTKAEGYGHKSTVICPDLGYVTGEKMPSRAEAEASAAKVALEKLGHL